ncbi:unnamed protein product [Eruca vesicaria subsp. sativa]|uniref:Uncharacterized protein n=1 Tax=Eruca vesicaria subsp. sativa TaxID=29727 RepID=A0ABC8LXS8_ERUVS|nr:unnamed protein product [Eruca vesicaria subsp. sativa]
MNSATPPWNLRTTRAASNEPGRWAHEDHWQQQRIHLYSSSASTLVSQASSKAASELSRLCTKQMICFLYAKAALLQVGRQYPDNNIREYTK